MSHALATPLGEIAYDLLDRVFSRSPRPAFGLDTTTIDGRVVTVRETPLLRKPFCVLRQFRREVNCDDPKLLIVAPLSGHFAVLLHDMVAALVPEHDVYVTDWVDARVVPLVDGAFGLGDNIGYIMAFVQHLGPDVHVIGLCQSAVPALAATALLAANNAATAPRSLTLLGGPIEPRLAPTRVQRLLIMRSLDWFERNVIATVSSAYPAAGRKVYPSSLQLMALTAYLARHVRERRELSYKLDKDLQDGAGPHTFLRLYTAVMDLTAEFFLENVKTVFQESALAKGLMTWRDQAVDLAAISRTALFTVEAELDDISGPGQTRAAHELAVNIPSAQRAHHTQSGIGHFSLFHGDCWRTEIMPRVRDFIRFAA